MRVLLMVGALVLLLTSDALAAPCPGAAACPYASVTQIGSPPAADEVRAGDQVAVGPGGVLWVADAATSRIARFSPSGVFQGAIGGSSVLGFINGLAVSPATGDVYVTEGGSQGRVIQFSATGQILRTVGPGAGLGQVTRPYGVAIRPLTGRVYVAEDGARKLQSFDATLGDPLLASSAGQFSSGSQLAFDAAGANLWALHPSGVGLSKFSMADLSTPAFTVCPNGPGVGECNLAGTVHGLTIDADGRAWIPDRFNDRIQRFNADGGGAFAYGAPGPGDLGFHSPGGIAADGASLVVTDFSGRIRRYDRATLALQSTLGGRGPGGLVGPQLAMAPDGTVLQQDAGAAIVRQVGFDGAVLRTFGAFGLADGQLYGPRGVATDEGANVVQLDRFGRRLQKFTAAGAFVWARGPLDFSDPARIANGTAVATAPGGEIFVTDMNRHRVAVYSGAGSLLRAFGEDGTADGQFRQPIGVTVDDGSVFVLDSTRADVQRFSSAGSFQGRFGAPGGGPGEFLSPNGIAADRRGAVYVLDAGNSRVQTFGRDGSPRGSFGEAGTGPGQLDRPVAIAADAQSVVVSDASGRVQRFALPPLPGAAAPGPPAGDKTAPKVTLRVKRQRLRDVLRRGLRVSCTTSERATCQVSLVIARKSAGRVKLKLRKGAKDLLLGRSRSVTATAQKAAALTVRPASRYRGKLGRRAVRSVVLLVRATARDAAGNVGRRTLVVTLRR